MTLAAETLATPGWSCVHFTAAAPALEDLITLRLFSGSIDATTIKADDDLLDAIATALRFPDYFGGNWDAFDECLRDMSWAPAAGYVLTVKGAEELWRRDPRLPARLIRSWLECARAWAVKDVALQLVFEW